MSSSEQPQEVVDFVANLDYEAFCNEILRQSYSMDMYYIKNKFRNTYPASTFGKNDAWHKREVALRKIMQVLVDVGVLYKPSQGEYAQRVVNGH